MDMLEALKLEVISILSKVKVRAEEDVEAMEEQRRRKDSAPKQFQHESAPSATGGAPAAEDQQVVREGEKVGRNDPCPCGSGKKYKHCHGKLT